MFTGMQLNPKDSTYL